MLKNVYCYAENTPSAKPNAFDGSNLERAVLHVFNSSIDSYKAALPWNKFSNISDEDNNKNISQGAQGTFDLNGDVDSLFLLIPQQTKAE